jgi:hypothetical protein
MIYVVSPSTLSKVRGSRRTWSFKDIFLPRRASEGKEMERHEMELEKAFLFQVM